MSFRWWSSCVTDPGKRRRINEDAYFACEDVGLWVIADGMGGHLSGDLASRMVAESFEDIAQGLSLDELVKEARLRLELANHRIQAHSREISGIMGSTVVLLAVVGNEWACLWAGDSRGYRLMRGGFSQITRDHSMLQELIDRGEDTDGVDPRFANRITRAVGATPNLVVDEARGALDDGGVFLLCSDGLNKEVADDELAPILDTYDCEDAALELLQLTLERGARDNVTLAVIRFESLTGSTEISSDDTAINYAFRRKLNRANAAGWS